MNQYVYVPQLYSWHEMIEQIKQKAVDSSERMNLMALLMTVVDEAHRIKFGRTLIPGGGPMTQVDIEGSFQGHSETHAWAQQLGFSQAQAEPLALPSINGAVQCLPFNLTIADTDAGEMMRFKTDEFRAELRRKLATFLITLNENGKWCREDARFESALEHPFEPSTLALRYPGHDEQGRFVTPDDPEQDLSWVEMLAWLEEAVPPTMDADKRQGAATDIVKALMAACIKSSGVPPELLRAVTHVSLRRIENDAIDISVHQPREELDDLLLGTLRVVTRMMQMPTGRREVIVGWADDDEADPATPAPLTIETLRLYDVPLRFDRFNQWVAEHHQFTNGPVQIGTIHQTEASQMIRTRLCELFDAESMSQDIAGMLLTFLTQRISSPTKTTYGKVGVIVETVGASREHHKELLLITNLYIRTDNKGKRILRELISDVAIWEDRMNEQDNQDEPQQPSELPEEPRVIDLEFPKHAVGLQAAYEALSTATLPGGKLGLETIGHGLEALRQRYVLADTKVDPEQLEYMAEFKRLRTITELKDDHVGGRIELLVSRKVPDHHAEPIGRISLMTHYVATSISDSPTGQGHEHPVKLEVVKSVTCEYFEGGQWLPLGEAKPDVVSLIEWPAGQFTPEGALLVVLAHAGEHQLKRAKRFVEAIGKDLGDKAAQLSVMIHRNIVPTKANRGEIVVKFIYTTPGTDEKKMVGRLDLRTQLDLTQEGRVERISEIVPAHEDHGLLQTPRGSTYAPQAPQTPPSARSPLSNGSNGLVNWPAQDTEISTGDPSWVNMFANQITHLKSCGDYTSRRLRAFMEYIEQLQKLDSGLTYMCLMRGRKAGDTPNSPIVSITVIDSSEHEVACFDVYGSELLFGAQ